MSIGKKHHALRKAWARVFNAIQIFWGLEVEINKYGKQLQLIQSWKFKS